MQRNLVTDLSHCHLLQARGSPGLIWSALQHRPNCRAVSVDAFIEASSDWGSHPVTLILRAFRTLPSMRSKRYPGRVTSVAVIGVRYEVLLLDYEGLSPSTHFRGLPVGVVDERVSLW